MADQGRQPDESSFPSLADRFWSHSRTSAESEDQPEPGRSAAVVRNFLTALEFLDGPVLLAMLRKAEVEGDQSYASPEQLRGETLDAKSVIFSLGVVLFERLTGRHPFGAENNRPRRLDRIRRGELGSGVNSFPTIPAGLRSILVRAMSPFAEERFADLRELRIALKSSAQDSPAPRLPGASEDEPTRVVRKPTDFGQELMRVVAEHDESAPTPAPPSRQKSRSDPPPPAKVIVAALDENDDKLELRPTRKIDERPAMRPLPTPAEPSATPAPKPAVPSLLERAPSMPPVEVRKSRGGLVAIGGAIAGSAITLAVVFATKDKSSSTATAPAVSPPPTTVQQVATPDPAVKPPDPPPQVVADPTPPATTTTTTKPADPPPTKVAEPTTKPAPPPPATGDLPTGAVESQIATAIAGCLEAADDARVFGLSIYYGRSIAGKAYFGSDDPIEPGEKTCISKSIKGITGDGVPVSGTVQYNVHATADGQVEVTSRQR
jgi:serine/threonine protein kinase